MKEVHRKNLSFSFVSVCLLCTLTASCLFLLMDKFPCFFCCSTKPWGRRGNKKQQPKHSRKTCEITAGWKWKWFRAEMYLPFSKKDPSPSNSLLCGEAEDSAVLVTSPKWIIKCHQERTRWNCMGELVWPDRDVFHSGNLPPWIWGWDQEGRHIECMCVYIYVYIYYLYIYIFLYTYIYTYRKCVVMPAVTCCSAAFTNHASLDARTWFH